MARTQMRPGAWAPDSVAVAPSRTALAPAGAVRAPAAERPAATRRASRRQAWRWALLAATGWLIQLGLRVWLSRAQAAPLANPDESAYLIAARVLAGGPASPRGRAGRRPRLGGGSSPPAGPPTGSPGERGEPTCSGPARLGPDLGPTD